MKKIIFLLMLMSLQAGCATVENDFDPLEPMNRKVDSFNTGLDEAVTRPIAQGYTKAIPKGGRNVVTNFFANLQEPNTIVNDVLQGKIGQGAADTGRFLMNSTLGIAGLFDVAKSFGLEKNKEDLGQTLAVWGADQGAYIEYPFLGPNSVRGTPGSIMAYFLDGATYIYLVASPQVVIGAWALKFIDERANVEKFVKLRDEMALDAYVFTREGWRQSRVYNIYDGHPPEISADDSEDDFGDDEFGD